MSEIATGAGVDLAYAQHGAGAPVLLIHGLAGDCRALAPLAGEILVVDNASSDGTAGRCRRSKKLAARSGRLSSQALTRSSPTV